MPSLTASLSCRFRSGYPFMSFPSVPGSESWPCSGRSKRRCRRAHSLRRSSHEPMTDLKNATTIDEVIHRAVIGLPAELAETEIARSCHDCGDECFLDTAEPASA